MLAGRSSPSPSTASASNGGDHRWRKKYTTTTVTTITTTTILLPKMQEAFVLPSVTAHQLAQQQQRQLEDHPSPPPPQVRTEEMSYSNPYLPSHHPHHQLPPPSLERRVQEMTSGGEAVGESAQLRSVEPQYREDGTRWQEWGFRQQSQHEHRQEDQGPSRPTLKDLGIASYFGDEAGSRRSGPAYMTRANGEGGQGCYHHPNSSSINRDSYTGAAPQPWIASEARREVEGGRRQY